MKKEFWTRGDIAKDAGITGQAIRQAEARGEIEPVARTRSNISLFEAADVARFLNRRKNGRG